MALDLIKKNERHRSTTVWQWAALAFLFLTCCMTRLYDLGWKSIMHDEALFVYYTHFQLYKEWTYQYLPILHGPAMLQLQAMIFHLFGSTDFTMRLGCALLGIGGFYWIYQLRHWLGRVGTWSALTFYTLSPGITFYQRFYRNDALYLFTSLWIVTSFAYWWKDRKPAWLASAVIACTVLFTNKESSLFVYFSVITFFVILVIHDLSSGLLSGQLRVKKIQKSTSHLPNPFFLTIILGGFIVLCLTQIFEGIKYDDDVVRALGHNWVLKDVKTIPVLLGWTELDSTSAPDAGGMASSGVWKLFYGGLFFGLLAVFSLFRLSVKYNLGQTGFLSRFWDKAYASRWHLLGAVSAGIVIYLGVFTSLFTKDIGFFEIYADTWSYWGGQHEWGRIGGPFHQHLLNMLIYELPVVLIVGLCWFFGLFQVRTTRATAIAFFLMLLAVGGFHHLIFSGIEVMPGAKGTYIALSVNWLKYIFLGLFFVGGTILIFPKSGKVLVPVSFVSLVLYSFIYLHTTHWGQVIRESIYRDGVPIKMSNRHVSLWDFMEIQFNFDGGTSLAIVLILIFFATIYTWISLEKGQRFHAFLIWWTVTATGAASYAREAVPQVGIHAMLPLGLLAASYLNQYFKTIQRPTWRTACVCVLGFFALWTAKTSFNLNFRNSDDVRERLVYGAVPHCLVDHCQFVEKYHAIAPVRVKGKTLDWVAHNNHPTWEKQVRVGVSSGAVTWPVRWYLRDIDWIEEPKPDNFVTKNYEFLFVEENELSTPQLKETYLTFTGSTIRFYQPKSLDSDRLIGIWKMMIPGHYLDGTPQAGEAWNAKAEWKKIWRYMMLRETFDGGIPGSGNVSGTQYVFCVRKDLY
jgi:predicted membrane-bound mannosyltransferase